MMKPKTVLFRTIPMYHYNCTMTMAQLELIAVDKPVSYIKKEKKGTVKPTEDKIQAAIDRYNAKQKKQWHH